MFSESELAFLAFVFIITLGCPANIGKKTKRQPSSKKAKQEETQMSKM